MNIPERGLGRGLSSLLSSAMENSSEEPRKLALTQLVPGKNQPRKHFDNNALGELAASIRNQGVIQPLLVRLLPGMPQRYEIVAGERRWRAARMAGLTEVPVIVKEYTDKEAMTVALVENLQREDLNPMEEAEALQALREAHGLSQEELAEQKKELERQKEKEVESLGRMVLDIENMKREFRKFYQLAESLTDMQDDLNQFRKVASDVRQMKTAMSQLQVSAKLNGNAVARILQQMQEQEPEPDSTEDSAES